MRILIANHFPLEGSGSGIYTMNLARELTEQGHDVKVIFPENKKVEYTDFKIRPIYFAGGGLTDVAFDYNFPCFTSHPRSNNTYYALTQDQIDDYVNHFVAVIKEEVDSFKPDVIHAQHLWITPYAAAQTGVPYIVTAHGTDLKGFVKDDRYHKYAIEGAKKATKIITISKQVDAEVEQLYGVEKERRALILNGYDENLFKVIGQLERHNVLKEFGIDRNPKHMVSFVGKLTDFKGVDVLLKAARCYEDKLGDVLTIIAGNGELYESLLSLKKELELKNVFFIGHVNQRQLVDIYNVADVSTVPSRTEPFGLVAIEALACGTPVVGTNQGGLPDFVIPEVGELVPVEDDLALAKAIYKEITRDDHDERCKYSANYAKEHFSWKHSIHEVEQLYKNVMK